MVTEKPLIYLFYRGLSRGLGVAGVAELRS
jgi:hypothetical protein